MANIESSGMTPGYYTIKNKGVTSEGGSASTGASRPERLSWKREGNSSFALTFHKEVWARDADSFWTYEFDSVRSFIAAMKAISRKPAKDKASLHLMNGALFVQRDGKGYRRQANFLSSRVVILDFDGGKVSPEIFESIFGKEGKEQNKLSFIIYKSFSRSKDDPNRFRVVVFLSHPLDKITQHGYLVSWIEHRMEVEGYRRKNSGLDKVSRSGTQSFYVPCTNRAHPNAHFFREHNCKPEQLKKYTLDPQLIPLYPEEGRKRKVTPSTYSNSHAIEPPVLKKGKRHEQVWEYALAMAKRGYGASDIKDKIVFLAQGDREVEKKARDAIASLNRYGWFD
jgi:hypothetical protein